MASFGSLGCFASCVSERHEEIMKTVNVTEAIGWGGDHHCTVATIPGVSVTLFGAVPGHRLGIATGWACDEHEDCRADLAKHPSDPKLAIECRKRGQFLHRFVVGDSVRHSELAPHGTIVSIRERLIVVRASPPTFHHSINDWAARDLRTTKPKLVRLRLAKFALLNWNNRKETKRPSDFLGPASAREHVIGFGPTLVTAKSTAIFQAQPQVVFRGTRLIIPSSLAENFVINDIRVGRDSQKISAASIPATAFSELAVGVHLGLDTATPGILITLSVTNTSSEDQTFSGALIGTTLQAEERSPYPGYPHPIMGSRHTILGLRHVPGIIGPTNDGLLNDREEPTADAGVLTASPAVLPAGFYPYDSSTITADAGVLTASPAVLPAGFYPTIVGIRGTNENEKENDNE